MPATAENNCPCMPIRRRLGDSAQAAFDVKNAQVAVLPKPTTSRPTRPALCGSTTAVTLDFDGYYSPLPESVRHHARCPDRRSRIYYLTSPSNTKGVEAESNIAVGGREWAFTSTVHSAAPKYADTHLWWPLRRVTPNRWRNIPASQLGPRLLQQTYGGCTTITAPKPGRADRSLNITNVFS